MVDKQKFHVVINGIEDWFAIAPINPERLVPESVKHFYQEYDEENNPTKDLIGLKVIDVCWHGEIAGQTFIRLGSLTLTGTLLDEAEFDAWLANVEPEDEDVLLDFEGYKAMRRESQPAEI